MEEGESRAAGGESFDPALATLIGAISDPVLIEDGSARVLVAAPGLSEISGYPVSELETMQVGDLVRQGGEGGLRLRTARGIEIPVELDRTPIPGRGALVTVIRPLCPAAPGRLAVLQQLIERTRRVDGTGIGSELLTLVADQLPPASVGIWRRRAGGGLELEACDERAELPRSLAADSPDETFATGQVPEAPAGGAFSRAALSVALVTPIEEPGRSTRAWIGAYGPNGHSFCDADRSFFEALATMIGLASAAGRGERLREALERAEGRIDVGALSAGLAHDFNNLLSVILSYSRMISSDPLAVESIAEKAEQIEQAAVRGSQLTRGLVDLARGHRPSPTPVDVVPAAQGALKVLASVLGHGFVLSIGVAPGPLIVRLSDGDFERMLSNLVLNARDAMPDGGLIRVGVRPDDRSRLVVSVIDEGEGMSPQIALRASEPGFTTKGRADGAGFGLSAVDRTLREAGGELRIRTARGTGTEVTMTLPLHGE